MNENLARYVRALTATERIAAINGDCDIEAIDVVDSADRTVSLSALKGLLEVYREQFGQSPDVASRIRADQWLGPRLHYALRLTRRQAADKETWLWLAVQHHDIVTTRWGDDLAEYRWHGDAYFQSFARLWWAAELYRLPGTYEPVVRALGRHLMVDRWMRRKIVRNRDAGHAVLNFMVPDGADPRPLGDSYLLADAINVAAAGTSPEAEIRPRADDRTGYREWRLEPMPTTIDWTTLPDAPGTAPDLSTSSGAEANAAALLARYGSYMDGLSAYER